jgi:hypothetical protein
MGHRFTAIVAFHLVEKQVQDSVLTILSSHGHYQEHFFDQKPEIIDENEELMRSWLFSQMAVWSDVIKGRGLNYTPQYRKWHYINYPIHLTELDARFYKDNLPVNLELKATEQVSEEWNISQAFDYNLRMIDTGSTSDQAMALCWIFHLLGDIHQPLHSTALYNERRFMKGDLGGNAISVKGIGVLHVAWDRSTYNSSNKDWTYKDYDMAGRGLIETYKSEGLHSQGDSTFDSWLNESHALAQTVGYPKELLEAVRQSKMEKYGFGNRLILKLDKDFTEKWKAQIIETSLVQITKAGYRLAILLNSLFKTEAP